MGNRVVFCAWLMAGCIAFCWQAGVFAETGNPGVSTVGPTSGVRALPGLQSITFFERTNYLYEHTFGKDSAQLTTRLGTLHSGSYDFRGADIEYYDVFCSDAAGNPDPEGDFLTIEARYDRNQGPGSGGLNLTDVRLNFEDGLHRFADLLQRAVLLGGTGAPTSICAAVDGNLNTHTTLGNTVGTTGRLAITVGFRAIDGDANGDCKVDLLDLIRIRNSIGADLTAPGSGSADVNGDCRINVLDLLYTRNRMGNRCS